ncbi:MAG: 2-amino-4-hydroxy-6-hydroxymethyldihydropteridine diphosphokinase [Acidobacteriota bacterium]
MDYYFSLGSNIGNREEYLRKGIICLKETGRILNISSVYETGPVGMVKGTEMFLNIVVHIDSDILPENMIKKIKGFEKRSGRKATASHLKPREIDIDIIFAGNLIINTEKLIIPHREMEKRLFVLYPLNEISPEFIHPVSGLTMKKILKKNIKDDFIRKIGKISDISDQS